MRRSVCILVGFLCSTLCLGPHCLAKGWLGITPLLTTRSEVIKLLGEPKRTWETAGGYYDLPDERVTVVFIDPTCEREYPIFMGQTGGRPEDLVLEVYVTRKKPLAAEALDELDTPDTLYLTMGCHPGGPCTLWSPATGFGFTTAKGGIIKLYYSPPEAEFKTWGEGHKTCRRSERGAT